MLASRRLAADAPRTYWREPTVILVERSPRELHAITIARLEIDRDVEAEPIAPTAPAAVRVRYRSPTTLGGFRFVAC